MRYFASFLFGSFLFLNALNASSAGVEASELTVRKIYTFGDGLVWLSITDSERASTQTCNHYGGDFAFYTDDTMGSMMLSTLMAARLSNQKVGVKYEPTTATVGSNQTTGCGRPQMAVLKAVYF